MMNKFFKKCLFTVLTMGLATSAYAADITPAISGMVSSYLTSSGSAIDMKAEGDLTAKATVQSGSWTITAAQRVDLDTDDGKTSPSLTDQYISMADDSVAITAGRFDPYEITMGGTYAVGSIVSMATIGDNTVTSAADNISVELKDLGLTAILSMDGGATTTTVFGVIYKTAFSGVDIAGEFLSNSVKGGNSSTLIAVAGSYAINDAMSVALNIESLSQTSGSTSTSLIYFNMGLGKGSGVNVGLQNANSVSTTAVTYAMAFDAASVYATYTSSGSTSTIGGGLTMSF